MNIQVFNEISRFLYLNDSVVAKDWEFCDAHQAWAREQHMIGLVIKLS